MRNTLGPDFFDRKAPVVAKDLLGKYLLRKRGGKEEVYVITETEAYCGFKDMASHARFGITKRNAPMFAGAGTIYVYFTYGMHWMLNIVCGKEGYPSAVLVRGVYSPVDDNMVNGPAKLTKALGIDGTLNGRVLSAACGLWIEDGVRVPPRSIQKTPRIGIAYAGEWVHKPWRFVLRADVVRRICAK